MTSEEMAKKSIQIAKAFCADRCLQNDEIIRVRPVQRLLETYAAEATAEQRRMCADVMAIYLIQLHGGVTVADAEAVHNCLNATGEIDGIL